MAESSYSLGAAYFNLIPSMSGTADAIGKELNGTKVGSVGSAAGAAIGGKVTTGIGSGIKAGSVALGNIVSTVAIGAASGLSSMFAGAIDLSDARKKFESTMEFAGFDQASIDRAQAAIEQYAADTVYDLGTVSNTAAQLAANGVDDFVGLTEAVGNLNAAAGGSASSFESVALMLTQTVSAGKLTTENWNQLADAIPGASGIIQDELRNMGAYTGDFRTALEKGEISAEEFSTALMNLGLTDTAKEAATSTETMEGAIGSFEATVTTAMADVYDSINGDGKITGAITALGESIGELISSTAGPLGELATDIEEAFAPLFEAPEGGGNSAVDVLFEDAAIVIGSVLDALGEVLGIIGDILALDFGSALNGVGDVVYALGGGLNDLIDTTFPGTVAFVDQLLTDFSNLGTSIGDFFTGLSSIIVDRVSNWGSDVATSVSTWWADNIATPFSEGISEACEAVAGLPETVGTAISEIPTKITEGLETAKGNWDAKWTEISTAFSTWWTDSIATPFGDWLGGIGTVVDEWGIADNFTTAVSTIQGILEAPFTAALEFIGGIPAQIVGFFTGIGQSITDAIGSISFPTPHVTWEELSIFGIDTPISLPHVEWYGTGGIIDGARVVGVGERGPEAIVPLYGDEMLPFAEAVAAGINSMGSTVGGDVYNVYLDGEALRADEQAIELLREFVAGIVQTNGRKAVFA